MHQHHGLTAPQGAPLPGVKHPAAPAKTLAASGAASSAAPRAAPANTLAASGAASSAAPRAAVSPQRPRSKEKPKEENVVPHMPKPTRACPTGEQLPSSSSSEQPYTLLQAPLEKPPYPSQPREPTQAAEPAKVPIPAPPNPPKLPSPPRGRPPELPSPPSAATPQREQPAAPTPPREWGPAAAVALEEQGVGGRGG